MALGGSRPAPDELAELLHRRGLRATPQRRAVLEAVRTAGGHVTAESIFEQVRTELPTISLKTVYDTLHSLVAVGEMRELYLGSGPVRFDPTVRPHSHLICLQCHRIDDVDLEAVAVADHRGFSVIHTDVIAWGRCSDCEAEVETSTRQRVRRPSPT